MVKNACTARKNHKRFPCGKFSLFWRIPLLVSPELRIERGKQQCMLSWCGGEEKRRKCTQWGHFRRYFRSLHVSLHHGRVMHTRGLLIVTIPILLRVILDLQINTINMVVWGNYHWFLLSSHFFPKEVVIIRIVWHESFLTWLHWTLNTWEICIV